MSKTPLDFPECNCGKCVNKCIHEGTFRRLPQEIGGLGLCENLMKKDSKEGTKTS